MKSLKKFEFPQGRGRESLIDWDKACDGGIYQLNHGEDYNCKDSTMRTLAYRQARQRGKTIRVAYPEGVKEGQLVIRAEDASASQVEAWAEQDKKAAEKAAADKAAEKNKPAQTEPVNEESEATFGEPVGAAS